MSCIGRLYQEHAQKAHAQSRGLTSMMSRAIRQEDRYKDRILDWRQARSSHIAHLLDALNISAGLSESQQMSETQMQRTVHDFSFLTAIKETGCSRLSPV